MIWPESQAWLGCEMAIDPFDPSRNSMVRFPAHR